MKKWLSLLLVFCMILSIVPISAMAEEEQNNSGTTGEIIAFAPLTETKKNVSTGTFVEDLNLPTTLAVTVRTIHTIESNVTVEESIQNSASSEGYTSEEYSINEEVDNRFSSETTVTIPVTWTSQPEYDMNAEGDYVFTPVIEGYMVNAELPTIKVTVKEEGVQRMMLTSESSISVNTEEELRDAIANVSNGEIIKLTNDIELNNTIDIYKSDFTINLNGHELTNNTSTVLYFNGTGTLTIIDEGENNGKIIGKETGIKNIGGHVVINGGTIISTDSYAIYTFSYLFQTNTLTISGATLSGNGGIEISNSTVTISNSTVSADKYYGIYNLGGTVTISESTVNANQHGFYNYNGTLKISDGPTVFSGTIYAMNTVPNLDAFKNLQISASKNSTDGSDVEVIQKKSINTSYKYLKFDSTYTITYNDNGASGLMENGIAIKGKAFTLPLNNFTAPEGKRFKAWAIGSIDGEQIKEGDTYTFTSDTTLYAVWEDTYTINGIIKGTDTDNGIPNANVTLKNDDHHIKMTTFTDSNGKYSISNVPAGTYTLEVSTEGYQTFTMNDVVVNADIIIKDLTLAMITYTITATAGEGGTISPSDNVTVNNGDSQTFTITPNSHYVIEDVKVDNVSQGKITSYTFDDVDTNHTIFATFRYTGSSKGSGGGGSSTNHNIQVIPPSADNSNSPTQGEIKVSGSVDSNGNVTVNITEKMVNEVFDKAFAVAKKNNKEDNGITLIIHANTNGKVDSHANIHLPKSVQEAIIAKNIINIVVVVDNPNIQIALDLATIKEIHQQAQSDVTITATRMGYHQLSNEAKNAICHRPAFDFLVNNGQGKLVQNFGNGNVSVTIPYTLGEGEEAEKVKAVYADENGKVHWLTNSVYDSEKQELRFSTNHFSIYGIGYKQGNTDFNHLSKDEVNFLLNYAIISATSTLTLNPTNVLSNIILLNTLNEMTNSFIDNKQEK